MEFKMSKPKIIYKTANGYKFNWFASRNTQNEYGKGGVVDDKGKSHCAEQTLRVKGMCECSLLDGKEFGRRELNLVKHAIYSALYALDCETFLYNDKARNKFINYVLKNKVKLINLDISHAWTQLDISKLDEKTNQLTTSPYQKRYLIEDGKKLEELIEEEYGRKYAFIVDLEIVDEEN